MRKVFVVMLSTALIFGVQSQVMAQNTPQAQDQVKEEKKAITLEELPDAVKQALASDANKEFTAASAAVMVLEGTKIFEVTGTRGEQSEVLLFSEDGKQIVK